MELLGKLGIDWKLFLAQIVNFFVLLYLLKRFAYKPLTDFLEARRSKIERGLEDAEEAKQKLLSAEESHKESLAHARKEARMIVDEARISAKQAGESIIVAAREESSRMLAQTKQSMEEEKRRALKDVETRIAELVAAATEKVTRVKLDQERDQSLIHNALESVKHI